MKTGEVNGDRFVELTGPEALTRVAAIWQKNPSTPLKDLYGRELAELRELASKTKNAETPGI